MKTTQDFNIWFDIDGMNIVPPVCRRAFASLNKVTAWTFAQALYAYVKTGRICLRRCRYGHSSLAIFDLAIAYIDLLRRQTADSPSGEAVSTTISDTAEVAPDAVATGVDRITDRNSDKDSDTPREEEKITETKVSPTPPSKIKTTEREEEKPALTPARAEAGDDATTSAEGQPYRTFAMRKARLLTEHYNNVARRSGLFPMTFIDLSMERAVAQLTGNKPEWEIKEIIDMASRQPFLCGQGRHGFRADLFWILQDKNYTRIKNGYYDDDKHRQLCREQDQDDLRKAGEQYFSLFGTEYVDQPFGVQ